jgi:hypothetical protein
MSLWLGGTSDHYSGLFFINKISAHIHYVCFYRMLSLIVEHFTLSFSLLIVVSYG